MSAKPEGLAAVAQAPRAAGQPDVVALHQKECTEHQREEERVGVDDAVEEPPVRVEQHQGDTDQALALGEVSPPRPAPEE